MTSKTSNSRWLPLLFARLFLLAAPLLPATRVRSGGKKRRGKGGKKQKRKKRTKDVPHKRTCLGAGISGPRTRGFRPQDNIGRQRAMREKLRQKRRSCGRPSEIQWSARAASPGKCSPRESEPRSGGSLEKSQRAIAVTCGINEQRGSGVRLTSRILLATQLAENGIN